jgi:hypothetical protein
MYLMDVSFFTVQIHMCQTLPIFHWYSSGCLVRGLPQEYFISLRYSNHAGHGIAFSSLPGIAGGLRYLFKRLQSYF